MATVTEYDAATLSTTTNASVYTSASFTPAVGDLLVVSVIAAGTVTDPATLTGSGNGVTTFTQVDRATFNSAHSTYIFVADALATGTASMTVEFDCTGDAATGCIIMVCGVVGMSKTGADAIRQFCLEDDQPGGTQPQFVFPGACLTGNVTVYALGEISTGGILTPTNWTEGDEASFSSPTCGGGYGYRASGFTGTTVDWPGNETAHGGVFVELDTSSSGGTEHPVSGQVDAVTALTATVALAAALSGAVAGVSAGEGEVQARLALSGQVDAASTASGTAGSIQGASGSVAGTSATTGTVGLLTAATGTAEATTTATGAPTLLAPVSGTTAAVSTVSGAPDIVNLDAAGTIAATSDTSGAPTLLAVAAGTCAATTTAAGTLGPSLLALMGLAPGVSAVSGAVELAVPVSGVAAAVSGVSGAVDVLDTTGFRDITVTAELARPWGADLVDNAAADLTGRRYTATITRP